MLTKPSNNFSSKVRHWQKYYDLCRVCSINWDFIGKLETVEEDADFIMNVVGMKGKVNLGLHQKNNDKSKMVMYFKGVEKWIVEVLRELYKEDFELFDYEVEEWLLTHLMD